MEPLTDDQIAKLTNALTSQFSEHFDGFVLCATVAGTGQIVTFCQAGMDPKTKVCLASMLAGAIPFVQAQ